LWKLGRNKRSKAMKVKEGLQGRWREKRKAGEIRKSNRGGENDQSTLYAHMEML
jgi:hypothetical protein